VARGGGVVRIYIPTHVSYPSTQCINVETHTRNRHGQFPFQSKRGNCNLDYRFGVDSLLSHPQGGMHCRVHDTAGISDWDNVILTHSFVLP
jgi:hypothetical protein